MYVSSYLRASTISRSSTDTCDNAAYTVASKYSTTLYINSYSIIYYNVFFMRGLGTCWRPAIPAISCRTFSSTSRATSAYEFI